MSLTPGNNEDNFEIPAFLRKGPASRDTAEVAAAALPVDPSSEPATGIRGRFAAARSININADEAVKAARQAQADAADALRRAQKAARDARTQARTKAGEIRREKTIALFQAARDAILAPLSALASGTVAAARNIASGATTGYKDASQTERTKQDASKEQLRDLLYTFIEGNTQIARHPGTLKPSEETPKSNLFKNFGAAIRNLRDNKAGIKETAAERGIHAQRQFNDVENIASTRITLAERVVEESPAYQRVVQSIPPEVKGNPRDINVIVAKAAREDALERAQNIFDRSVQAYVDQQNDLIAGATDALKRRTARVETAQKLGNKKANRFFVEDVRGAVAESAKSTWHDIKLVAGKGVMLLDKAHAWKRTVGAGIRGAISTAYSTGKAGFATAAAEGYNKVANRPAGKAAPRAERVEPNL